MKRFRPPLRRLTDTDDPTRSRIPSGANPDRHTSATRGREDVPRALGGRHVAACGACMAASLLVASAANLAGRTAADAPAFAGSTPAAAEVPAQRASPRATLKTFVESVHAAVRKGEHERMAEGVNCLDLSLVPETARKDQGPLLAKALYDVLARLWKIDWETVPDAPAGPPFRHPLARGGTTYGMLEVVRRPEGNWVLSADFVAGLAELRSRVADLPPIEGLHGARAWAFFLEDRMPDALRRTAFILPHWQWAALLALAFLGFAVDLLVYGLCRLLARRLLNPMRAESVETALHRAERPLGLVAMALLWLGGLYFINLPPRAYSWVAFGARLFAAVAFSFAAYRAVDVLSARLAYWASTSRNAVVGLLAPLVRRTLKIFVAIVAFLSLADRCGFDVSKMLIGLGVGGLALAMASKDTVENLFGSFTVVLDRPFKIGDWIKIGDVEGIVEEVGFRSTRIRTFSQSVVILPNFRMVNATIENNQERPKRRISATLSVNYGVKPETIEAFCEGIRELIRRQDSIDQDTFYVYLSECGAFSLDILVVCFVRAPDLDTELRERERLFTRILRLAGRLEVTFRAGAPASPSSPAIGSDFARELGRREAAALAGTGEGPAPSARAAPGKTT